MKHRRKNRDRLVPIDGDRLSAAIDHRGLTRLKLKDDLQEKTGVVIARQTIDHIVIGYPHPRSGRQARCRAAVRKGLAALLDIPEEWLAGEDSWGGLGEIHVQRAPYNVPPRSFLRSRELVEKIVEAWVRDIKNGAIAMPTHRSELDEDPDELFPHFAQKAIQRLLQVWWCRQAFFDNYSGKTDDVGEDEADQFTLGIADALEILLLPWFNDKARLDSTWAYLILEIVSGPPQGIWLSDKVENQRQLDPNPSLDEADPELVLAAIENRFLQMFDLGVLSFIGPLLGKRYS